jgi:hypothetical protein
MALLSPTLALVAICEVLDALSVDIYLLHCKNFNMGILGKGKGKAIPLQALTGPEGSRRLRLPGFKTFGT